MELRVQVKEGFWLDAGTITEEKDDYLLLPPKKESFDQLWNWLEIHPRKDYSFHYWALGIGATALCYRWGTYLAVLMDENKLVDPRAAEEHISMIFDGEMKRINIEASYNVARLLQKMHENEYEAIDYILRAYDWLPMPQKRVKANWQTITKIYGTLAEYKKHETQFFNERSVLAVQYPYRSLANTIVALAYRNGPVENAHAGAGAAYRLTHRRFTTRQAREVIRSTSERMAGVLGAQPAWAEELLDLSDAWPQRLAGLPYIGLYPYGWSLEASSSQIILEKEWCQ